jgi:hypothetical protein
MAVSLFNFGRMLLKSGGFGEISAPLERLLGISGGKSKILPFMNRGQKINSYQT